MTKISSILEHIFIYQHAGSKYYIDDNDYFEWHFLKLEKTKALQ